MYVHLAPLLGFAADDPTPDYDAQVGAILDYLAGAPSRRTGSRCTVLPRRAPTSTCGCSVPARGERDDRGPARPAVRGELPHRPSSVLETVDAYRGAFRPSPADRAVRGGLGGRRRRRDADRARRLAAPYAQWVLDIRTGGGARPYVTPDEASAREWTAAERAIVADRVDTQFVGSPRTVAERLATLARVTGADELLVTTITTEHADRVRSTELLAESWAARGGAA